MPLTKRLNGSVYFAKFREVYYFLNEVVENCCVVINTTFCPLHEYCSIFNLSHCVEMRSQGYNAVTIRLKRVVIPLQQVPALTMSSPDLTYELQLYPFYTPGIYAEGYIVFVFLFVRTCVRSFVRLFVRLYFVPFVELL